MCQPDFFLTRYSLRSLLVGAAVFVLLPFGSVLAQDAVDVPLPSPESLAEGGGVANDPTAELIDPAALGLNPEEVKGLAPEEILLLSVQRQMEMEMDRLQSVDLELRSLFFNAAESKTLRDAVAKRRNGQIDTSIEDMLPPPGATALPTIASGREVALGGIIYHSDKDWTIWVNNQRMTPDRLPAQIKGIKVYKGFVEVQWLDDQTGTLIPIRLRPNQRFDLDTRRFLPG